MNFKSVISWKVFLNLSFVLHCMVGSFAQAAHEESEKKSESVSLYKSVSNPSIERSHNYLQSGLFFKEDSTASIAKINYYYRVSDQFLLGVGYSESSTKQNSDRDCQGDLATGDCYSAFGSSKTKDTELAAIYYFSDLGYKNWGFYLNPAIGSSMIEVRGAFKRYDNDPGLFCGWFSGDCKRLQESGEEETLNLKRPFVKLGVGYQFIWTVDSFVAAHILDLGIGYSHLLDSAQDLEIHLSNGQTKRIEVRNDNTYGQVTYMIAF